MSQFIFNSSYFFKYPNEKIDGLTKYNSIYLNFYNEAFICKRNMFLSLKFLLLINTLQLKPGYTIIPRAYWLRSIHMNMWISLRKTICWTRSIEIIRFIVVVFVMLTLHGSNWFMIHFESCTQSFNRKNAGNSILIKTTYYRRTQKENVKPSHLYSKQALSQ